MVRDRAIVKVSGYLSSYGGERLEEEVGNLLHHGNREIVINHQQHPTTSLKGYFFIITSSSPAVPGKSSSNISDIGPWSYAGIAEGFALEKPNRSSISSV